MPLRRDATGRQVHDAFADPRPDKVSSLSSIGGAPVGSTYVVISNDGTLTAERALAITAGQLVLADGGANASVTLSLADVLVAGGPIGNATTVPIITWDAKGRLTAVSSTAITGVPPGGAAGGDLSGTYPNPSVVDDSHNHTSTTLPATIVYDGDAAGGDLTGTYPNPTIADADLIAIRDLAATAGLLSRSGAGAFVARTLTAPAAGITVSNGTGAAGNPTLALANDLAALEGLSGTGLVARTASETYVERTLTAPAAGLTITNPAGIAGNPTFALANDLAALEAMAGTGIVVRTAAETYAQRTLAVTDSSSIDFTITNADGTGGNPTITAVVLPAGVDHGGLGGLADDDHTQYLLLLGRSGGQTAIGGTASGDDLTLQSTSHATRGEIYLVDEARLRSGLTTIGGGGGANVYYSQAVLPATATSGANFTRALAVTGTMDDQVGLNFIFLFSNQGIYSRSTSAALNGFSINALNNTPTIQSNGIALPGGTAQGFNHAPVYNRINAGTMTGMVDNAVICNINVGAGCTMTARRGLYFQNATVGGTLTTQAGVDIEALSGATNNIGIRNASIEVDTPLVSTLTAVGNTISHAARCIRLDNTSGGSLTLTSAPTITDGIDGERVLIFNGSANNVVISDQGTLASSNLRLSAATITLAPRDSIELVYSATIGDWIQVGQTNVI